MLPWEPILDTHLFQKMKNPFLNGEKLLSLL